ncbi:MAG: hypothetical protein ACRCVN_04800 [Spirochaetia bacterium]
MRLLAGIFAICFLTISCSVPTVGRIYYGDAGVPPVLPPLPPILFTLSGLEDFYIGRNTNDTLYVALELRKINATQLSVYMGEGISIGKATSALRLVSNVHIYPDTIYDSMAMFVGANSSKTPVLIFLMNSGWQSFDIYPSGGSDPVYVDLYRLNDPHQPYL